MRELAREVEHDYGGHANGPLMLVAPLKSSVLFLVDLARALRIEHTVDFVELAGYGGARAGGTQQIRLLKDLDSEAAGRDILLVEDVVDTGLTLNFLIRTLGLRGPRSLAAVTLFDRPYRRLVDDLPVRYVGFTIPDELFVGYGFDLDQRYRNLPDIYSVLAAAV